MSWWRFWDKRQSAAVIDIAAAAGIPLYLLIDKSTLLLSYSATRHSKQSVLTKVISRTIWRDGSGSQRLAISS